jgi:uncharacterized protein (DUF1778 family)
VVTEKVPTPSKSEGPKPPVAERQLWEDRNIRVTFWLDRALREEVRAAAKERGLSVTQFIARALRRAVDDGS